MQAMGVVDVQRALDRLGLKISVIEFTNSTATSELQLKMSAANWDRSSKASDS